MGFYVETVSVEVTIPAAKLPEALQVLKDLDKPENNHLKRGGSWSGGVQTSWHYSWMNGDWAETAQSCSEVFQAVGFTDTFENETGLELGYYDSKTGQEDIFLNAVAPFVDAGSYIEWRGEDGSVWKNVFDGQKMKTLTGRVMYGDDIEQIKREAKQELADKVKEEMVAGPGVQAKIREWTFGF